MAWVRLSDDFYDHPKFDRAGPLGIALFAAGLAWCNRNLSDGIIPRKVAARLLDFSDAVNDVRNGDRNGVTNGGSNGDGNGGSDAEDDPEDAAMAAWLARRTIRRLIDAGLWHESGHDCPRCPQPDKGDYVVHDYLDYQPPRVQVEAERDNNAARQKAWRQRRKAERQARDPDSSNADRNGDRNGVTNGGSNGTVTGAPNPNPNPREEVLRTSSSEAPEDASGGEHDPPPATGERGDVERLCTHLRRRVIDSGKPAHRVQVTKSWRAAARLLIDRDGVTEDQAHAAIDWVQNHSFWHSRVRSMPKLREKYFELRDQARGDRTRTGSAPPAAPAEVPRCSRHAAPLPCDGCAADAKTGDTDDLATLAELLDTEGPDARPDLAQLLDHHGGRT